MKNIKALKDRLRCSKLCIGSWITLAHPAIAEIMARAGFEWIVVDLEHSTITIREAEELIRTIDLCGSVPLVRLSANDPVQIKRVMDAGAYGVIVPMVNNPEEAEAAVASVYYPPRGRRGVGLARAQGYGSSFESYQARLARETVVIVQVEHIEAVDNLDAILAVPGVDGFIVGPYDLSASLGVPGQFDHPHVRGAFKKIRKAIQHSDRIPGTHVVEPDPKALAQAIRDGYRFIAYSVDIRMLDRACRGVLPSVARSGGKG